MKLSTLALIAAAGYGYLFLKNNPEINASTSEAIKNLEKTFSTKLSSTTPQGGTTTVTSTDYDILVNTIPGSTTNKYQLVYDVIYDEKRYTLYVLKDWTRKDIPKPFISSAEYYTLSDEEKQQYSLNTEIANGYQWYQVLRLNLNYNILQNPPLNPAPNIPRTELISKSLPLGFIPIDFDINQLKNIKVTTGNSVNVVTPVNPSKAVTNMTNTQIGVTLPLLNLQRLKQALLSYGVTDVQKLQPYLLDGVQVLKVLVTPTLNTIQSAFNAIKNSGLAYNVEMLDNQPVVKEADIYHPEPIASNIR